MGYPRRLSQRFSGKLTIEDVRKNLGIVPLPSNFPFSEDSHGVSLPSINMMRLIIAKCNTFIKIIPNTCEIVSIEPEHGNPIRGEKA
jgi:hypothetical protein